MTAPMTVDRNYYAPAVATASTAINPCAEAPFDGVILSCQYTPQAAITGVNTNTRQLRLVNRGQAGAGTTALALIQFNAGTNGVAFDEVDLTLQGTPTVAQGDILAWESNAIGTGLADPGGRVQITFSRT
jgi:hypothetical protein